MRSSAFVSKSLVNTRRALRASAAAPMRVAAVMAEGMEVAEEMAVPKGMNRYEVR